MKQNNIDKKRTMCFSRTPDYVIIERFSKGNGTWSPIVYCMFQGKQVVPFSTRSKASSRSKAQYGDKSDKEFAGKKTWRRRRRLEEREWVFVSLWKLKTLAKARLILFSIFLCFLYFLILVWFDLIWCRLQNMNGLLPGASQLVIERAT